MSILHVWQRYTRLHATHGGVWLLLIALPVLAHAEPFTGKVIGISDGDTISVLREGKAVKVRLYGVDAPEKAQAFGTKAQQFTAALVCQKDVTVMVHATDRYGRIAGEVLLPDGRSLSQELVKAGMAWWYKPYAAKDTTLAQLEAEARAAQRGSWADAHPIPPWEWRKETHVASAASPGAASSAVHGNRHTKVYHLPGCPGYNRMQPTHLVPFVSEAAAEQAGYHRAKNCP